MFSGKDRISTHFFKAPPASRHTAGEHGADFRGRLPRIHQTQAPAWHGYQHGHGRHAPGNAGTYQREMDNLESHLSFLATVGRSSPYVGLFGTVWGIMNSFRGLSNVTQATIAHVAPGIAEALIATAMGLFAAIPAVIAYNRYASHIDRLATRFESFMEELSNVLQRQASG